MPTLLEKALETTTRVTTVYRGPQEEEFELLIAYLEGRVSGVQMVAALGIKNGSAVYSWIAIRARAAFAAGKIKRA